MMSERLTTYLQTQMPAARDVVVSNLERKSGGASRETWAFTARWSENARPTGGDFILRRDPTGSLLESDREREFAGMRAVHGHGMPVPRMLWLELDPEWLERPFFVMERVDGVAPVGTFPEGYSAAVQARITQQFIDILARIHTLDWRALGLASLGVPEAGTAAARTQVEHWERIYRQERLEPHPILEEALRWL